MQSKDADSNSNSDLERMCLVQSNHTLRSQRRTVVASFPLAGWLFDINKNKQRFRQLQMASTTTIRRDRKQYRRGLKVWLEFLTLIVYSECSSLKILQPKEWQLLFHPLLLLLSIQPCRSCSIHPFPQDCSRHLSPRCWVV